MPAPPPASGSSGSEAPRSSRVDPPAERELEAPPDSSSRTGSCGSGRRRQRSGACRSGARRGSRPGRPPTASRRRGSARAAAAPTGPSLPPRRAGPRRGGPRPDVLAAAQRQTAARAAVLVLAPAPEDVRGLALHGVRHAFSVRRSTASADGGSPPRASASTTQPATMPTSNQRSASISPLAVTCASAS